MDLGTAVVWGAGVSRDESSAPFSHAAVTLVRTLASRTVSYVNDQTLGKRLRGYGYTNDSRL